ncbi:MAG: toprim domain-containing protein [Burkholderiales bacterium]|nr:toprim domain-containing protein [Burkholderiales bacterium]
MYKPTEAFRAAILTALGHAPDEIEPGRMQRFPTSARRGDTAGWCKLFTDLRGGVFGDFRSGLVETWCATDRAMMTAAQRAAFARQVMQATAEREADQRRRWAENAERIAKLQAELVPLVPGDPVTLYLKRRGFAGVWPLPACLRLHRALPYWHEGDVIGTFPAMVAPIVARDGHTVALHRTWLTRDGRKADVPSVRKVTAASGPLAGACIPLFQPERGRIGIAEGVETALAAWCASGLPTVAAYSAGNLAAWHWPAGVQRVVIFADHDAVGTDAAEKLRQLARAAGLSVSVMTPTEAGDDWCDVWAQREVTA